MSDLQQESEVSASWSDAFANRLRAARERAGMSQEEVHTKLGFPVRSITRWENGKSDPGFEKVALMAELYGVSNDWIAGRTTIEVCIQPGMILVDESALAVLGALVAEGKRMSELPEHLLRRPGINFATVVPASPTVLSRDAAASVEGRMRRLWQQLGGS